MCTPSAPFPPLSAPFPSPPFPPSLSLSPPPFPSLSFSRWRGDLCSLDFFAPYGWFLLRFFQWFQGSRFLRPVSVTLLLVILSGLLLWGWFCFASFGLVLIRSLCSVPRLLGFVHIARCSLFSIVLLTGLMCEIFLLKYDNTFMVLRLVNYVHLLV